jgi:hypothetical protein
MMHYWTYVELRKILPISFQKMKYKKNVSSDDAGLKEGERFYK